MNVTINKQIEFVQILLFLTKSNAQTEQVLNNKEYCSAIDKYFIEHKNHPAVKKTKELVHNHYFTHIKPLRAILTIDEIINDPSNSLHEWGILIKQFYKQSDCNKFFLTQTDYYNWILTNVNNCNFNVWIEYIKNYFRQFPEIFHLIICPINGNYGFNIKNTAYTIRNMPQYDDAGNAHWNFDFFAKGIAHEYAHCFVNPTVKSNKNLLDNHEIFFNRHENMYNYYNVNYAVINEYWVRAFAIRFMEQNMNLFPSFDINEEYKRQKNVFFAIDYFINSLKVFEQTDMSFSDFYINNINDLLNRIT